MCVDVREKTPLVSVIMPAYNTERFIAEAIDSVIRQTVTDWELIVINDSSDDATREIVKRYVKKYARIHLYENAQNLGVAKTRNRGLELCNGRYVALLDSDDYWHPNFLEKMVCCAERTNADLTYCSYELIDECGDKICKDFIVPLATTFEKSIVRSVITCSTVLMRSEIAKNNHFPTDVYHEDIALWFSLLQEGKTARGVPDVLAAYRQRANSRSAGKIRSACRRWTIYRKYLKMPFIKSAITIIRYGYYGIKKFKRI